MAKHTPEFKAAFKAYRDAIDAGLSDAEIRPLWDAVMRTLHETPEPPVGLYSSSTATAPGCAFTVHLADTPPTTMLYGMAAWFPPIDRHDRSPLDDDFDRMMREG